MTIMRKIFYAAQFLQKQNKCVQSMLKLMKEVEFEEFYEEFCRNVKCALGHDCDNPKVICILDMVVTFTILIKNENLLKNKLNEDTFDELGMELFGKDTFFAATITKTYKNLLDFILTDALIPFLSSLNVSTRLNTLYMVRKILEHCSDIEINIYNRLRTTLLDRINDKNVKVRISAAHTLRRFQTAEDPNDAVIHALKFHLKYDPAPNVRLACLNNIWPTSDVIPDLITKTRDIGSKIREIAFKKIAKTVDLKQLTVSQRITLLNNGFKDRNEKVKLEVHKSLVPAWIKCYDDIIHLLTDLDVNDNMNVISKFLDIVFQYSFSMKVEKRTNLHLIVDKFNNEYLDEQIILSKKKLSSENCLFWRCLGAFLNKNEDELMKYQQPDSEESSPVDMIIPPLSNFVAFFKNFCIEINDNEYEQDDLINFEFIFKELCLFLDNYEIVDDSQKQRVTSLVEDIIMMEELGDKFDEYIEHLIKFLSKSVFKTNEEFIEYTVRLTNKVHDTLEQKNPIEDLPVIDPKEIRKLELNFAREAVGLHELKDKLDEALARREYDCAHEFKQKIEVIEDKMGNIKHDINKLKNISIRQEEEPEIEINIIDHPVVHLKLLQIFGSFLRYGTFKHLTAMMDTRINEYILPGILSTDPKIRYFALKALNHACFLRSSLSTRFCALYHEICTKDNEHLVITALKGLIDALIEHGLYILNPYEEEQPVQQGEKSILDIPAPFEENTEEQSAEGRKKSNANSMFTNTREFTKASSFLNKSEITSPDISMMDEEEEDFNKFHHNTNNESDLDSEANDNEDDELNDNQANLTMKSQILDKTINKTQLQIEKEEEIIKQLTKFLLKFIRSNNEEFKATSVMAICKLLLLGKIYSPLLLSELILLWYNSSTTLSVQHDIGTFLPIYCQASTIYNIEIPEIYNGQHCLLECFMSTVENVYRLERGEQLEISFDLMRSNYYDADIDVANVIEFMLNLLEPKNHVKIALEFCERILTILQVVRDDEYEHKEPFITKYLIKSLTSFQIIDATAEEIERLRFLVDEIQKQTRYQSLKKLFLNKIEKFAQQILVPEETMVEDDEAN